VSRTRKPSRKTTKPASRQDDVEVVDVEFQIEESESESHVDDPVRMYLMQMGEIPMLNRAEEIDSAKRIEATRTKFRRTLLCNDYVLHGDMELLEKVAKGELRLDRTIDISVTNTAEKKRILKRIGPNLETIKHLLELNTADYLEAVDKHRTKAQSRAAWRRLISRRNKVIRLVEEMNLRLNKLIGKKTSKLDHTTARHRLARSQQFEQE